METLGILKLAKLLARLNHWLCKETLLVSNLKKKHWLVSVVAPAFIQPSTGTGGLGLVSGTAPFLPLTH